MSLTKDDLQQIRTIVQQEIGAELAPVERRLTSIEEKVDSIDGCLRALESDVKEIYLILARMQALGQVNNTFQKKSLEDKLLELNKNLLAAAKQAGIVLPR